MSIIEDDGDLTWDKGTLLSNKQVWIYKFK